MAFKGALDFKRTDGAVPVPIGGFTAGAVALSVGMPVVLTAGLLVVAASNATKILGWMAQEAAASDTDCLVYLAEPSLLVKLVFDGTYAAGSIPLSMEITVAATYCIVNNDEVTNELLNMMSLVDATNKIAWFSHKYACCQAITAND